MTETVARADVLHELTGTVDELVAVVPQLIDAANDEDGVELAGLLLQVRTAREQLQRVERDLEAETAKAMSSDLLMVDGQYRVERARPRDRKEWNHDAWTADARRNLLRRRGLLGAVGVVDRNGEVVDVSLAELMRAAEDLHGKGAPRITALRELGLDPDEYCATSPGQPRVRIVPLADDTEAAS